MKVKDLVSEQLTPFLEAEGLELYKVEFVKEAQDWFLRVFIEKPEGAETEYVDTEDCEKVSRYLSDRLDELDPIEQNYYLEVSSPGLDRELIKDSDYVRFAGREVEVKLYKAFEGSKSYAGKLVGRNGEALMIEADGKQLEIPANLVAKVNLAVIF